MNEGDIVGNFSFAGELANAVVNKGTWDGQVHLGSGDDTFTGVGGKAVKVFGESGNDTLVGGSFSDTLTGGADRDIFGFNSIAASKPGAAKRDKITDFQHGDNVTGDDIDLRAIDAKSGGGNQAFHFIGSRPFHHVKGELHTVRSGANVIVQGDTNGDGKADFEIMVLHHHSLAAGDFLL